VHNETDQPLAENVRDRRRSAGINVFSLLHTLLARQSLRDMVDSQATPSLSIRLTQDIPGGRYERSQEDRAKSRSSMLSPRTYERDAGSRLARRAARGDVERGLGGEYLSEDDPEKDGESHRRERPVSVSRGFGTFAVSKNMR
jgi:hypothetical protein